MKRLLAAIVVPIALLVAAPAWGADGVTLFGTATVQSGGVVRAVSDFSDASTANDAGGVQFSVASGTTLASLTTLSAEFNVTDDDCGGGSPRFQIQIDGKNLFVYLGPSPSFRGCPQNTWISSGNLVGTADACRVDTSQFASGTQCSTWAQALALLGSHTIQSISFVADGGWSQPDKEQTVLVRNVRINGQTFLTGETGGTGGGGKLNPAQLCKAERQRMGDAAFSELWGTNGNDRNAFGKCVSTVAHARNAGQTQQAILDAVQACQARGLKGAALGACVAASDGVSATRTEAQERGDGSHDNGKHKGKGKHK